MARTKIEWTEETWNPVTGCTSVSRGCDNCYARRQASRLAAMGMQEYRGGFAVVRCHEHRLSQPMLLRRPSHVFVCSMGDLFHHEVSADFVRRVFDVMRHARQHTFQVLTKRAESMREVAERLGEWPRNVWAGVTIEDGTHTVSRLRALRDVPAPVRFISFEPLLAPVTLAPGDLDGISWAVVGGETGPHARAMDPSWVASIRDACEQAGVNVYLKRWGHASPRVEWLKQIVALENEMQSAVMVPRGGAGHIAG